MNNILRYQMARKRAGLTQFAAAEALGISISGLRNYESGRTETNGGVLAKMADLYNTTVDYLLGLTDYSFSEPPFAKNNSAAELLQHYIGMNSEGRKILEAVASALAASGCYSFDDNDADGGRSMDMHSST